MSAKGVLTIFMSMTKKLITIICPFYNELDALPLFCEKLFYVLDSKNDYDYEIIFVDNASDDGSLEKLKNLTINLPKKKNDYKIKIISFTRNFGYQKSLLAGYNFSNGDASIVIDTDLEDPPNLIIEFLDKWEEGYDVVYGKRIDREENFIIKKLRNYFYKLLTLTADFKINNQMAEFCLISKKVRELVLKVNTTFTFFRSEIAFLGLKTYSIDYKRKKRVAGNTKYDLIGMIKFAVTGFLTTSTFFLRFFAYFLPLVIVLNILYLILIENLIYILIFDIVYLLINLSIISLYVGRMYQIFTKRPPYIIDYDKSII